MAASSSSSYGFSRRPIKSYQKKGRTAAYRTRYSYNRSVPRLQVSPLALGETKYFDTYRASNAINASTNWTNTEQDPNSPLAINCLFAPQVGNTISTRVGRRVDVKKIKIRGYVRTPAQANVTDADPGSYVRLILVQDTQTNGTQMQGEDLMQPPTLATADQCPTTFQNLENFGRFKVLRDMEVCISNPNTTYDGTNLEQMGQMFPFKINVTFSRGMRVHFNSTNGGTVADIVDNSFHVLAIANSVNLTPQLVYSCRVSYKDL